MKKVQEKINLVFEKLEKYNIDYISLGILFVGAILFLIGILYDIPSREFSFYEIKQYVGGDAYNALIESSIRGGEIAGAKVAKAIYICAGLYFMLKGLNRYKENQLLQEYYSECSCEDDCCSCEDDCTCDHDCKSDKCTCEKKEVPKESNKKTEIKEKKTTKKKESTN